MNPYDSPKSNTSDVPCCFGSGIVERLITGDGTEVLVFYDLSDHQLFGRKHRTRLTEQQEKLAVSSGCHPIAYQAVLWWCLVFIPIVPLGVFAVIQQRKCDDPNSDTDQYRGIRLKWDWNQIAVQYGIIVSTALFIVMIVHRLCFSA